VDVSQYAGKTVTLLFTATTDSIYTSSFFVDDVALLSGNNCVASAAGEASVPAETPAAPEPKPTSPEGIGD
jgi:hypothetical protein